jgi:hypothetical protein
MRTEASFILNEFISNLTTIAEQKGFQFYPDKILGGTLQTYVLLNSKTQVTKSYFLFLHVSTIKTGFWGVNSFWQEKLELNKTSSKGSIDWAIILLQEPRGKNYPLGFLIPSNDFANMKSDFKIDRMGQMKILEKDLHLKNQFNNWDTFFQLLNL